MKKAKVAKEKKPNYHLQLVKKFVNIEFCCDKYFWPREMKFAGNLLKKYPKDFLIWLQPPENYKMTSLIWFITKDGQNYMNEQYFQYTKSQTNLTKIPLTPVLLDTKIGEDVQTNIKPRTLKEFINMVV